MATNNTESLPPVPAMKLEVVPIPVSDVDRAIAFYVEQAGFHLDHDVQSSETMRVAQLTPPGSACSIVVGTGLGEISEMQPGSVKGIHLVIADIEQARAALIARGVAMGEVIVYPGSIKFSSFSDPDGNTWTLQEFPPDL